MLATHTRTLLGASPEARRKTSTARAATASTTTLVYRIEVDSSSAAKPARPTSMRRRSACSRASMAQSTSEAPTAMNEASVKVDMVARQAKESAAPEAKKSSTA